MRIGPANRSNERKISKVRKSNEPRDEQKTIVSSYEASIYLVSHPGNPRKGSSLDIMLSESKCLF